MRCVVTGKEGEAKQSQDSRQAKQAERTRVQWGVATRAHTLPVGERGGESHAENHVIARRHRGGVSPWLSLEWEVRRHWVNKYRHELPDL